MVRLFLIVTCVSIILSGCNSTAQIVLDKEQVKELLTKQTIANMWSSDINIVKESLVQAREIKDPRILVSLIGKLESNAIYYNSEHWYPQLIIKALSGQGAEIKVSHWGYFVKEEPEWLEWDFILISTDLQESWETMIRLWDSELSQGAYCEISIIKDPAIIEILLSKLRSSNSIFDVKSSYSPSHVIRLLKEEGVELENAEGGYKIKRPGSDKWEIIRPVNIKSKSKEQK